MRRCFQLEKRAIVSKKDIKVSAQLSYYNIFQFFFTKSDVGTDVGNLFIGNIVATQQVVDHVLEHD